MTTPTLPHNPAVPPLLNDDHTTRLLWEALYAITVAVEELGQVDAVDALVSERWEIGAHAFSRFALSYSVLGHPANTPQETS